MSTPHAAAVKTEGLRRTFGDFTAVDGIDLDVRPGEIYGFLGPNGAGKSTVVRMLTTLLEPTGGRAWVGGLDVVAEADDVRFSIGVALQEAGLDENMTGREILATQGRLFGLNRSEIADRIEQLAPILEMRALDQLVSSYSGGMARRLDLAAALMHNPSVLFLDEPTTGLDPETQRNMWTLIGLAKPSRCIVLTTHSMEEADALCGRIGIMAYGSLRCLGTSLHLKHKFGDGDKLDFTCRPGEVEAGKACIRELIPSGQLQDAGTALEGGTQCARPRSTISS